jgi:hypothetical protein
VDLFSEAYDVYMGCPSDKTDPREIEPGHPGFLGNPFYDGSFQENLLWFKHYFLERLERDRRFRKSVLSLHGCRLGCVCDIGTYCHAHIVADWINENYGEHQHLFQYQLQEINKNLRQAN